MPPVTRQTVIGRAQQRCESCGSASQYLGWSVHHRKPRGMGGTSLVSSASPANLLLLCGSGTTGCHGWFENHRTEAKVQGILVPRHAEPTKVPVYYRSRWVLLTDDGDLLPADPPDDVPAVIVPTPRTPRGPMFALALT